MDDPNGMLHSSFPFKSDGNERCFQKPGCENETPLKKRRRKSYMQPTISAVSKAVAPKKKILGERDEDSESISSATPVKKSRILESKLSFNPYEDPSRNYLSPGNKFIRYDPIYQCRDILLRKDEELEVEREGRSNSEEEIEDAEEKIFWRVRGVLNYKVIFAVLALSILYVFSVNSPNISSALRVVNDGSYRIRNRIFTVVNSLQDRREFDGLIEVSHGHAFCDVAMEEEVIGIGNVGANEAFTEVAGKQNGQPDRMADEDKFSYQESDLIDIGFRNSEILEDFHSPEDSHQDLDNDYGEISSEEIGNEEVITNEVKEIEDNFRLWKGIIVTTMASGVLVIIGLIGFQSSLKAKSIDKSMAEEKSSLEIEEKKDTESVDSFVEEKSKCCAKSRSEVFQELAWREASSAELLGELALEDVSSSLKRCRTVF